jgi:hypothetical protein
VENQACISPNGTRQVNSELVSHYQVTSEGSLDLDCGKLFTWRTDACAGATGASSSVTCLLCSCSASGTLISSIWWRAGGAGGGGTETLTSKEVDGVRSRGVGLLAADFLLCLCSFHGQSLVCDQNSVRTKVRKQMQEKKKRRCFYHRSGRQL